MEGDEPAKQTIPDSTVSEESDGSSIATTRPIPIPIARSFDNQPSSLSSSHDETDSAETSTTSVSYSARSRTAAVRHYFEKTTNGRSKCKLCKLEFSAKSGSSTLGRHVKSEHPEAHQVLFQQKSDTVHYAPYGMSEQAKIDAIQEALLRWLVIDQQAYSTVDSGAFQHFVAQLNPRFRVPCRQTITKKISDEFHKWSEQIKGLLVCQPSKVSITTDIWTVCSHEAFLGIVVHWINAE